MTTPKNQLSQILEIASEQLDITQIQYDDAKAKYEAVGKWLSEPGTTLAEFNPQIYAQGSIRLGTTVKPLAHVEFDVDLVCEFGIKPSDDPAIVKQMVGDRLKANKIYKEMIQEKPRCWELNYAGQFHMDVLPAIPDVNKDGGCLWVPDKNLGGWKPSNPKGYADWFKVEMQPYQRILEKRAAVERMPNDSVAAKVPLQRCIQILKRHRDKVFKENPNNAPISIVITTLATKAYNGQNNLIDTLIAVIDGMPGQIDLIDGKHKVLNPKNPAENFAEKWLSDPARFEGFKTWLEHLHRDLDAVLLKQGQGLRVITESLNPMFGDQLVGATMAKYASVMEEQRHSGSLRMAAGGALGGAGVALKGNTFYGK